jgi:hypothetical protein
VRSRKGVSRPSVQTERGDGDEVTNVTPPDRFFHLLWRVAVLGLLLLLPSRGSLKFIICPVAPEGWHTKGRRRRLLVQHVVDNTVLEKAYTMS